METTDKIHEQKWKERREYDTWHHNVYSQMIKNKRNTIDITVLPYDKYQGQTVEEIIKDLKRLREE